MNESKPKSCCGPSCCPSTEAPKQAPDDLRDRVRDGYAKIAQTGSWSALQAVVDAPASRCCGTEARRSKASGSSSAYASSPGRCGGGSHRFCCRHSDGDSR
jgi:hypothetical protein